MFAFLLAGISFGLSAGFAPGPLFAMVISQTLRYGLKEGIKAALAPLVTDLPLIAVTLLVLANLYAFKPLLGLVSIAGGLFLLYLAYENMTAVAAAPETDAPEKPDSLLKGAVVNLLSPHPFLFWLTVGSPTILSAYAQGIAPAAAFLISFYVCLVGAKIVLAVLVNRSREFLAGKVYGYTMKILGILLLIFALYLLRDGALLLRESL